jgi:hypothetical protein
LLNIWGFGDKTVEIFGPDILSLVKNFGDPNSKLELKQTKIDQTVEDVENKGDSLTESRFTALKNWRNSKSKELEVPAFVILWDSVIREIALKTPKNESDLRNVKGIGDYKSQQYGDEIIEVLRKVTETSNIQTVLNNQKDQSRKPTVTPTSTNDYENSHKTWEKTHDKTLLALYKDGLTVDKLASHLKRSPDSIESRIRRLAFQSGGTIKSNSKKIWDKQPNNVEYNDFFKIKELNTFTPIRPIWDRESNFTNAIVHKMREENKKGGNLLNHHFPITEEEISKITSMYQNSKDIDSLEHYFQRSRKTIISIIKKKGLLLPPNKAY